MAFPALPAPLNLSITDPNDSPSKANPNAIFKKNQSVKTYKRQKNFNMLYFFKFTFQTFWKLFIIFLISCFDKSNLLQDAWRNRIFLLVFLIFHNILNGLIMSRCTSMDQDYRKIRFSIF